MKVCGDEVVGSSASVHVPAMLGIDFNGQLITRHVNFVGLDPETYDNVSHFGRYLLHPENRERVSFDLRHEGYAPDRDQFPPSGWKYRKDRAWHGSPTNMPSRSNANASKRSRAQSNRRRTERDRRSAASCTDRATGRNRRRNSDRV